VSGGRSPGGGPQPPPAREDRGRGEGPEAPPAREDRGRGQTRRAAPASDPRSPGEAPDVPLASAPGPPRSRLLTVRLAGWLDDRLGAASFARRALNKVFPDHWSFMLGEVALYCFVVLVLTGTFLAFFYVPDMEEVVYSGAYEPIRGQSVSRAYESVLRLSFEVRAGLVFRQIHHWAAVVMVAAVAAHAARVFFTGAFRRPRDLNWVLGVLLLVLTLAVGFSGYSLPDDQLSGTGLRIMFSVAQSVPVVGPWVAFLVFGGEYPAPDVLNRLFFLHVMVLPAAIATVGGVHVALVWHQKHTQFPGPGRTEGNVVGERLWPRYAFKSAGLFFVVAAVLAGLGGLAQINPVWLYGPYRVAAVSAASQPDWYFGWLEGALRLFPNWEIRALGYEVPNVFFPGVLLPSLVFLGMALWPAIERRLTGDRDVHHLLDRPRDVPWRTGLGAAVIAFMVVLTLAGGNDVLASALGVSVEAVTLSLRALAVLAPPAVFALTLWVARELGRGELHPVREVRAPMVVRTAAGGFEAREEDGPPDEGGSGSDDRR
jgi:ubiquinol-cytochrome c reductase cytochrome b subunit